MEKEWLLAVLDGYLVDGETAVLAVAFAGEETYLSVLENEEVKVAVVAHDQFFWVGDLSLDNFSQRKERLLHHVVEKHEVLEDRLIGLLEIIDAIGRRQLLHKLHLFLDIEQLLNIHMFLYVIIDLPRQFLIYPVLICQFLKYLKTFATLDVLRSDVGYKSAHTANVIGEDDATESLDEDHTASLLISHRHYVSESNSQHNRCSPVVGPDVLFIPLSSSDLPRDHPILRMTDIGHFQKDDGKDVCEAEIKEDDLHQRPVLLVVIVLDEVNLQLLQFLHAVGELE